MRRASSSSSRTPAASARSASGWRGEVGFGEELELKSTAVVRGAALAKFDDMALALEAHAYQISRDVYGKTEPMR